MKPLTPETADLRFRQKLGTLRSELTGRQRHYRRKRQAGLGLTVLGLLLVVVAIKYYWTVHPASHEPPAQRLELPVLAREEPLPATGGDPAAVTVVKGLPASLSLEAPFVAPLPDVPPAVPEAAVPTGDAVVRSTPTEDPVVDERVSAALEVVAGLPASLSLEAPFAAPLPDVPSAVPEATRPVADAAVKSAATERPVADEGVSVPTAEAAVARLEPSPPVATSTARVRVAESLTCLGVDKRQCVGVQSVFSLAAHRQPHVWMNVLSDDLPSVLKHVYYHNGQKYCEIALDIAYPRTRTWSNVTLQNPQHVGDWRVEVVTSDGAVLHQVQFQVVP